MQIYVIVCLEKKTNRPSISQEAYHRYEEAVNFINTRADTPVEKTKRIFEGEDTFYIISDVRVI